MVMSTPSDAVRVMVATGAAVEEAISDDVMVV